MLLPALTILFVAAAATPPSPESDEPLRLRPSASVGLGTAHGIVGGQLGLSYGILGAFACASLYSLVALRGDAEQMSLGMGGGVRLFAWRGEPGVFVQAAVFHELPLPSDLEKYELSIGPRTSASLTVNVRLALTPRMFLELGGGARVYRSHEERQEPRTRQSYWYRTEGVTPDVNLAVGTEF